MPLRCVALQELQETKLSSKLTFQIPHNTQQLSGATIAGVYQSHWHSHARTESSRISPQHVEGKRVQGGAELAKHTSKFDSGAVKAVQQEYRRCRCSSCRRWR